MKNTILLFLLLFSCVVGKPQANLGSTISEIKALHPDNSFKMDYANDGRQFISTDMTLGTFYYYINSKSRLCDMCLQIPNTLTDVNTQVQIYNRNYVITSDTTWKAYLDGGSIMYIKLRYATLIYSFIYTEYYQ